MLTLGWTILADGGGLGLPRLASTAARKVSMSQLFAPLIAPNRLGPAGSTLRAGAHSWWARMLPVSTP